MTHIKLSSTIKREKKSKIKAVVYAFFIGLQEILAKSREMSHSSLITNELLLCQQGIVPVQKPSLWNHGARLSGHKLLLEPGMVLLQKRICSFSGSTLTVSCKS